ncbi:MAG: permease [Planctomycetota bacterium]
MKEAKILAALLGAFLLAYFLPLGDPRVGTAVREGGKLLQWYAREHTLACVVPALFIAGGITTFLSPAAVLRFLGPSSPRLVSYSIAAVAGTVLAVCSCSVLPMFAGIYRLGAGLGPASAFLYSGPAINVLAIFLTARVLGLELGLWRAIGSVLFAILVGLGMSRLFRTPERARTVPAAPAAGSSPARGLGKNSLLLGAMIAFLIFSDWFNPGDAVVRGTDGTAVRGVVLQETRDEILVQLQEPRGALRAGDRIAIAKSEVRTIEKPAGWVRDVYRVRWYLAGAMGLLVAGMAWRWLRPAEIAAWMINTWSFAKLLVPLLFAGVFAVGVVSTLLPDEEIARRVGDDGLLANLIGSVAGALFYFATLTEVPITEALIAHGMARGPALALLLAGPAISLPSILVLVRVTGAAKTAVFTGLIVASATVAGLIYGNIG